MSIMKLIFCLGILFLNAAGLLAHPVAQGGLDITIFPDHLSVHARIAAEEIFVAGTFGGGEENPTLEKMQQAHGSYLLKHLFIKADLHMLQGTLISTHAGEGQGGMQEYLFNFPLPDGVHPAELEIRQNSLNEFEFAPGNRWEATYLVRFAQEGAAFDAGQLLTSQGPIVYRLDSPMAAAAGQWRLACDYLQHGIWHILTGYDHLLFVAALVLAVGSFWDLFKVLSAFTLAHTVTLTLSVLDVCRLPEHIVEPMIAASIVFVAVQNILWPASARGSSRLWIAFFFGLFHGLGFAGGLLDTMQGMSGLGIGLSIAAFSVGVEVGHLAVVLPLFLSLQWIRRWQADPVRQDLVPRLAMRYGSALISVAGLYYFVAAVR